MPATKTTWGSKQLELQSTAHRRLNVGCGNYPLHYWTNLDESRYVHAELHAHVPPLPFGDESLDDIYAGHFLEHLTPNEASAFLDECYRCLVFGGRLGIVVPDTREIMMRWLNGDSTLVEYPHGTFRSVSDLDEVCRMFLYSTVQESSHRWSYDAGTLRRLVCSHGFEFLNEINRYSDFRIPVGAWYQVGADFRKL